MGFADYFPGFTVLEIESRQVDRVSVQQLDVSDTPSAGSKREAPPQEKSWIRRAEAEPTGAQMRCDLVVFAHCPYHQNESGRETRALPPTPSSQTPRWSRLLEPEPVCPVGARA